MAFFNSLPKTILISLLGHITVFSIFSFSFGNRIPSINQARISFFGQILRNADLNNRPFTQNLYLGIKFGKKPDTLPLDKEAKEYTLFLPAYFKPQVTQAFSQDKIVFTPKATPPSFMQKKKEPVLMFHPSLPEHFLLYFKDRQTVHIELMFNIISTGKTNSIAIKRKISSGNLEADLLSMRYISHYLFIQQARFIPDNWQTVKIDLSTKND